MGQHFLVDLNIARKICDALSGGTAEAPAPVLEVGCGMGVLTQFLLRRSDIVVWGAEIDAESVDYLRAHYPEFTPRLMAGDFLRMELRALFPDGVRVIGNFPYNISSQIFFKVLEHRDLAPECVGMIQREVAERIACPPGSKGYGILSVLLQAWYDIEYLFTVGEKVFNPPPRLGRIELFSGFKPVIQKVHLVDALINVPVSAEPCLVLDRFLNLVKPVFGTVVNGALVDHGEEYLCRLILERAGM